MATPEQTRALASAILNEESLVETVIEWANDHLEPGDVFAAEKLEAWALAAGFQRGA